MKNLCMLLMALTATPTFAQGLESQVGIEPEVRIRNVENTGVSEKKVNYQFMITYSTGARFVEWLELYVFPSNVEPNRLLPEPDDSSSSGRWISPAEHLKPYSSFFLDLGQKIHGQEISIEMLKTQACSPHMKDLLFPRSYVYIKSCSDFFQLVGKINCENFKLETF